jgi:hypothetical protein
MTDSPGVIFVAKIEADTTTVHVTRILIEVRMSTPDPQPVITKALISWDILSFLDYLHVDMV